MKKILAVLLAVMLALSCTLAMAETAETPATPAFQGLTIESEYNVDRDTLKNVLTQMNTDESILTIVDTLAAIVDQSGEKVVVSNEGLQAELIMKGKSLLNLVALVGEGDLTMATNLVPNYALSISFEELGEMILSAVQEQAEEMEGLEGLDIAGLQAAVTAYLNDFITTCSTDAIIYGTPEQGEFVMDGDSYNTKMPMDISLPVILNAYKELTDSLQNDETVQTALVQLALMGVNVDFAGTDSLDEIDPAELPVVKVELYINMDENGQQSDPTLVCVYVIPVGETTPATTVYTRVNGNDVNIDAQFVQSDGTVQMSFATTRDAEDPFGTNSRIDIRANDLYIGCAAVTSSNDQSIQFDAYGYLQDTEKPVVTEHGSIVLEGALTLGVSDKATRITLSDLSGENSEKIVGDVMSDLSGAAISILMSAYTSVPELGALVGQLMGGMSDASNQPAA